MASNYTNKTRLGPRSFQSTILCLTDFAGGIQINRACLKGIEVETTGFGTRMERECSSSSFIAVELS